MGFMATMLLQVKLKEQFPIIRIAQIGSHLFSIVCQRTQVKCSRATLGRAHSFLCVFSAHSAVKLHLRSH